MILSQWISSAMANPREQGWYSVQVRDSDDDYVRHKYYFEPYDNSWHRPNLSPARPGEVYFWLMVDSELAKLRTTIADIKKAIESTQMESSSGAPTPDSYVSYLGLVNKIRNIIS